MNFEDYGSGVSFAQVLGGRKSQQDDFGCLVAEEFIFMVLADGMGGHKAGEEASQIVVENFLSPVESLENGYELEQFDLARSLASANKSILELVTAEPEKKGMGSTIVAFYKDRHNIQWLSVGDSHLYRFRDKELIKLNIDHSMLPLIMELVRDGKMDESEVAHHPLRNTLRSAITGETIQLIDYPDEPIKHTPKDIYILCTDGVDVLLHEELRKIIHKNRKKPSLDINRAIMKGVLDKESDNSDNSTVAVLKI